MLRILTQDRIAVDDAQIQIIAQRGPFLSFSEAIACIQDVIGTRRAHYGLTNTAARQITVELMARKVVRLDPTGAEVALRAHLRMVLEGHPLHPAIISRLIDLAPRSVFDLEIALTKVTKDIYGATTRPSLVRLVAQDLADTGAFDLSSPQSGRIMRRAA